MNEILEKKSFFKKISENIENNFKLIIFTVLIIFLMVGAFQYYFYHENKKILNSSIEYNLAKSLTSDTKYIESINKLSKEKNFYGILATLENVRIKLENNEIEHAYEDYNKLLNNNKLNNLYKSAIAVYGSYAFLNILNFSDESDTLNKEQTSNVIDKIKNLLPFIDESILSYIGFRLEILFLILIAELDMNKESVNKEDLKILYNQINENTNISSTIKDRVKIIYEFQNYK